jgi:hypothetical protein
MDQSGATQATNHCVRVAPLAAALFSAFSDRLAGEAA